MSASFSCSDNYMSLSANETVNCATGPGAYDDGYLAVADLQQYQSSFEAGRFGGGSGGRSYSWSGHGVNSPGSQAARSPTESLTSHCSLPNQFYGGITAAQKQQLFTPKVRVVKRRVSANKKERRRTVSINTAFTDLRDCIPNVPLDTKLSKIKTLKLATSYISWLMDVLRQSSSDDASPPSIPAGGFQTILTRTLESREDRRKRELLKVAVSQHKKQTRRNRTGWPQHVWAQELGHGNKNA